MNEPAFPVPGPHLGPNNELMYASQGMTLRDYFAGIALQGLLASYADATNVPSDKVLSGYAYNLADAMMAHREKT